MRTKYLIVIGFFSFINFTKAQEIKISGRVLSEEGEPLIGANVQAGQKKGVISNQIGYYEISLPPGEFKIQASYIGYSTIVKEVNLSNRDIDNLDFMLEEASIEMSKVEVVADEDINTERVTSLDLQLRPIQTSQEVLRVVPGLFIAQHAGGGKAEQIFLRGFDIDHGTDVSLSVDGMPVNMVSHAHGQGYADLHFLIPETIKKVDFNKGPYYADQGNFNTAGYVGFETLSQLDNNQIKLEGGQFGHLRAVSLLNLLGKEKDEDLIVASEFYLSDGYFESDQNFSRLNFMAKYSGKLKDESQFEVSAFTFSSEWTASGQIPERAVESGQISRFGSIDDTEGGKTSRTSFQISQMKPLSNNSIFNQQFYAIKYDFELVSNFTFFLEDSLNGDQITQQEERMIYGYNSSYSREDLILGKNVVSTLGGGLRYDKIRDIELAKTVNRDSTLNKLASGNIDEFNFFAYLSESIQITPKLGILGSLRFDYFMFNYQDKLQPEFSIQQVEKGVFSPKLILNYQLTKNMNVFAKAGIGFHSNDTRVVVEQNGRDILPKAKGLDFGASYKPFDRIMLKAAAWYLFLEQEFVYVGDAGIVEPSGKTERKGLDLSVRYQMLDWLYFDSDINVTDAISLEAAEGENYIPLAPLFTSTGGVTVDFENGISGSLRYRFLDDRPANEANSLSAEGYFLMDLSLAYKQPKYKLGVTIENVLNQEWREAQFETESRLRNEAEAVTEIHFTPGSPFFARASLSIYL